MSLYHRWFFGLLVTLLLLFASFPRSIAAQGNDDEPPAIMFVIDDSGSMNETDANQLRYAATRLILEVADADDLIGLVCFNSSPQLVEPLSPVGDTAARSAKINNALQPMCVVDGGTYIHEGIAQAVQQLQQVSTQRKYIILLTDGAPNTPNSNGYDPALTLQALDQARTQGIVTIPVALFTQKDNDTNDFLDKLNLRGYAPREITSNQALIEKFATIYSELKPDRYVEVLRDGQEIRIANFQQVNQATFVLSNGQRLNHDQQPELSPRRQDRGGKFDLVEATGKPLEGIWQSDSADPVVVITRANFRSRLLYPPAETVAQTSYYLPGANTAGVVALIPGDNETPVTINNEPGLRVAASAFQGSVVITQMPQMPEKANIRLGEQGVPLEIMRSFPIAELPGDSAGLPRLSIANPDTNGAVRMENEREFRLAIDTTGETNTVEGTTVGAVVVSADSGQVVFGPEPLSFQNGSYQPNRLLEVPPGGYRLVAWLNATRISDGIRYGDILDIPFSVGAAISVQIPLPEMRSGTMPATITVNARNRTVDVNARIEWLEQPPGVDLSQRSNVQLQQNMFSSDAPTATNVVLSLPEICDMPEGRYRMAIVFSSTSGLPVVPARVETSFTVGYGAVEVATRNPVDAGPFCALPGWLGWACIPLGATPGSVQVPISIPQCLGIGDVAVTSDSGSLGGDSFTPGAILPTDIGTTLELQPKLLTPINFNPLTWNQKEVVTTRIGIGRSNQSNPDDVVQIRYEKLSFVDAFFPWLPLRSDPVRAGNIIGLFGLALLILGLRIILFGRPQWLGNQRKKSSRRR